MFLINTADPADLEFGLAGYMLGRMAGHCRVCVYSFIGGIAWGVIALIFTLLIFRLDIKPKINIKYFKAECKYVSLPETMGRKIISSRLLTSSF